jgi:uncharacterized protein
MAKYRILSLDGGGSWSLIQARALLELFGDLPGRDVLSQFSFVVASSGGSIVLAAMLEGMKLGDILKFFLTESARRTIFVEFDWLDWALHQPERWIIGGPRYYTKAKLTGLQKFLPIIGGQTLAEARTAVESAVGRCPDLLITSFDYDRLRSIYFRSDNKSRAANSTVIEPTTVAEAVHASSNAPIKYFNQPANVPSSVGPRRCWDGGLAACNNPVLAGLTEVVANQYHRVRRTQRHARIEILSIGTASVRKPIQDGTIPKGLAVERVKANLMHNLERVATAVLDDPPDAATFTAYTMLGGFQRSKFRNPIVRMNPMIQPIFKKGHGWDPPVGLGTREHPEPFVTLADMDMDAVKQSQVKLIEKLTHGWIKGHVPNQPIRANDLLECQLGQRTFEDARTAWLAKITADKRVC